MRQQLARAGPRPAHLRELFDWQLEARDGVGPRWAGLRERGRLAYFHGEAAARWARLPTDAHCWRWLLGELADCADAMPDATCERLGLAPGSTYGHAVEALREEAASVPLDAPVALRHELPVDVAAHMCQLLAEGRWPGRLDVEVAKDAAGRLATSAQLEEAIRAEAGRQRPFRPGIPSDLGRLSVELAGLVDDAARFVVRL
jgi:hypothetical protein